MRVKLRSVRERLFVTQEELAERTGMSRATISRIESGQQRPRISTVRRLAAALGVSPEELIDWEHEESPEEGKAVA
jgi:transcriptional regulator with XRE-family HTH domain